MRKQCYRSVLADGCGVTYGHHSIWQFYHPAKRELVNHADGCGQEPLDRPVAHHLRHLRAMFESRPVLDLVPDQSLLVSPEGAGGEHVRAAREANGKYALVYLPTSASVEVRLNIVEGPAHAWWFDPQRGTAHSIGALDASAQQTFTPPPEGLDWVLVIDSVAAGLSEPGRF